MTSAGQPAPSGANPPAARRYVREEQIAAGGQGVVYLGRDLHTGETVIIKQLPAEQLADPRRVGRFIREGEALRRLQHPNIVRMLDAYEDQGQYAIVMEYVPGGDLRRLLDGPDDLPQSQILTIALELADALARAHHLGILHRDVKPENVLITAQGAPRLTDFGAALLQSDDARDGRLTRTGAALGSPAYMSPEALYGEQLDSRSDIWSFGILLFEMLAGRRPFEADSATHVMVRIIQDPPVSLAALRPDLPQPLIGLVSAMLVKDRANRLSSMRLVASVLEAILAGRPPEAFPLPPPTTGQALTGDLSAVTPGDTPPSIAQHLPARSMPFIGREQELREIAALLAAPALRLLTIMGPGGTGKTQLALQAARAALPTFPDGVFFVPLAPLSAPEEIIFAISAGLGVHFYRPSQAKQQLLEHLQRKNLLLVLDNFEHLLEGAALLSEIVAAAPQVTLLVTSRASLNLSFQHLYTLGGLAFPPDHVPPKASPTGYPAVRLLLQQTRLVRPDLPPAQRDEVSPLPPADLPPADLPPADLQAAAQIARLVQGMPLALILAARWAELLSLPEIAEEITRSLDFLDTTMQDLPPRQRSMRAVFDYSWQHLSPESRQAFARISVFRGGFTREAATQVAGAGLRVLLDLVRKSFLTAARNGRFEVHELLRQFGEEQLQASGHAIEICDAHSAYYTGFLARCEPDIKGRRQLAALQEIDADMQNIRRAWNWALERPHRSQIDQALESLHLFLDIRGRHQEAIALFARACDAFAPAPGQEPDRLWARLITRHAFLQVLIPGDPQKIEAQLQLGLSLARRHDDKYEIALATQALSTFVSVVYQDHARGLELGQRAHDLFQELDDPFFRARALVNLGISAASGKEAGADPFAFTRYIHESVRIARAGGDIVDVSLGLANLTEFAIGRGQYAQAREYSTEALTFSREIGSDPITAYCLSWLGCLDLFEGKLETATHTLHESLTLAEDIHSLASSAYAAALSALAAALHEDYPSALALAQQSSDNPANNTLGLIFTPWAFALAHHGLHNPTAARQSLREALQKSRDLAFPATSLWLLPVAALFLSEEGHHTRAAQLLALAGAHPLAASWHTAWAPLAGLADQLRDILGVDAYDAAVANAKNMSVDVIIADVIA